MDTNHEWACVVWEYLDVLYKLKLKGKLKDCRTKSGLRFVVYLPPNYNSNSSNNNASSSSSCSSSNCSSNRVTTKYPVLYHLHGATEWYFTMRREVEWTAGQFEKYNKEVVIVAPYDKTEWSWWVDGNVIDMFTQIQQDLIPLIESMYRVHTDRSNRFIQGFSMGGFGAVVHGFKRQDKFSKIIIWDGGLNDYETFRNAPYPNRGKKQFFDCLPQKKQTNGNEEIKKEVAREELSRKNKFEKWNPYKLIQLSKDAGKINETPILMVSKSDGFLPPYCQQFYDEYKALGGNIEYERTQLIHSYKLNIQAYGEKAVNFLLLD